jgi:peptide/nickel transport system ATP-binding protein
MDNPSGAVDARRDREEQSGAPYLAAVSVSKHYRVGHWGGDVVTALDDVSVEVVPGTSVGVVGESGSGKTTLLRLLLLLERPSEGTVDVAGEDARHLGGDEIRDFRRSVQAVFQDPRSSLDPRERVWQLVTEPAAVTLGLDRAARRRLANSLLDKVHLSQSYMERRAGELSGGECQRVAVARAISSSPRVIVLDEPVTSLDASLRGLVINLLRDIAIEAGGTYVVVSHDVVPVYLLTDYVYMLYRGRVVEEGPTEEVVASPLHPYTKLLIGAVEKPLASIGEEMLRPDIRGSCPYLTRCPSAISECQGPMPPVAEPMGPKHRVRCYLWSGGKGERLATNIAPGGER